MYTKDVEVKNQVGLHARPATFFIQKANEFKSSIWVEKEDRRVNAKSLLGVLSLGVMGGTTIRKGAVVKHCIVAENVEIGEGAVVGAMPIGDEKGVATIGNGVKIGANAKVGPNAMVREDVKEGEEQC